MLLYLSHNKTSHCVCRRPQIYRAARPVRLCRRLLQSAAHPLRHRLHHSTAGRGEIRVTRCPLFRGKVTTTNGLIGTHLIAACVDLGLSEVAGAGLLAATGVFALLGGTLAGWLSDRWDNRLLLCAYYGFRGLSLLYLPFAFDMSIYGLPVFAVVYGLDWIASAPRQCASSRALSVREDWDHGGVDYRHPSGR
jgi:hypothetical protein